jgi:thioesterase domain-containing protein
MARQLRAAGEDVALLALLDPGPPLVAAANDAAFAEAVREAEKARVAILAAAEEAARLPPSDPRAAGLRARLDELIRERKREDLLGTEPVLLRRIMRVIGAEMQAWPSYTPVRYEGEAHLFLSEERLPGRPDPAPEVQRWVRTLHVHRVPGSHHTMVFDPVHAKVLAARLAAALGEGGKGP